MGRSHPGHQGFAGFVVQFLQAGGLHMEGAIRGGGFDMPGPLRRHQENDLAHSDLLSAELWDGSSFTALATGWRTSGIRASVITAFLPRSVGP